MTSQKEKTIQMRIKMLLDKLKRIAILNGGFAVGALLAAGAVSADDSMQAHSAHESSAPAKLVTDVRAATQQFADVNAAVAAGYRPFLGCVTGPDQGAMGIHYVNGILVGDGQIDVNHPEALIYEPVAGGLQLVGVEYIVDAANWMANHNAPPVLDGQTFQYVAAPNRFGLPAFFELHVWAWRDNPK